MALPTDFNNSSKAPKKHQGLPPAHGLPSGLPNLPTQGDFSSSQQDQAGQSNTPTAPTQRRGLPPMPPMPQSLPPIHEEPQGLPQYFDTQAGGGYNQGQNIPQSQGSQSQGGGRYGNAPPTHDQFVPQEEDSFTTDSSSDFEDHSQYTHEREPEQQEQEPESQQTYINPMKAEMYETRKGIEEALVKGVQSVPTPPGSIQEEKEDDVFIDAKNKKLNPFGRGSKKVKLPSKVDKEKLKVNDFDHRKNLRTRNLIAIVAVVLGVLAIVGFGAYKTFAPEEKLSVADVEFIAASAVGDQGFPVSSGSAIAESFIGAYLTAGDDGLSDDILAYYSGGIPSSSNSMNREIIGRDYSQKILSGPIVVEARALTPSSATYTVGALVAGEIPAPVNEEGEAVAPEDLALVKSEWLFFSVNVYYDIDNNIFTIPEGSPTVVAPIDIREVSETPMEAPLGNGNEYRNIENIQPTVMGFLNAYAISTPEDWSTLKQYIIDEPPIELRDGLGGMYKLFDESAVTMRAWETDTYPDNPAAELKVDVIVEWFYSPLDDEDNGMKVRSRYVITLISDGSASYEVSRFAPFYYVQKDDAGN